MVGGEGVPQPLVANLDRGVGVVVAVGKELHQVLSVPGVGLEGEGDRDVGTCSK